MGFTVISLNCGGGGVCVESVGVCVWYVWRVWEYLCVVCVESMGEGVCVQFLHSDYNSVDGHPRAMMDNIPGL